MIEEFETPREKFESVLNEMGKAIGIEGLSFDDDDLCVLSIGDGTMINIYADEDSDTAVMYATVGYLPTDERRSDLLRKLLEENRFWEATCGFTLSLNTEDDLVVLADRRRMELYTSCDYLATHLANLIQTLRRWRNLLAMPDEEEAPLSVVGENATPLDRLSMLVANWIEV